MAGKSEPMPGSSQLGRGASTRSDSTPINSSTVGDRPVSLQAAERNAKFVLDCAHSSSSSGMQARTRRYSVVDKASTSGSALG